MRPRRTWRSTGAGQSLGLPLLARGTGVMGRGVSHTIGASRTSGGRTDALPDPLPVLGRERPVVVLPDRALCLPTFSHLLIVNKPSSSSSSSLGNRGL